MKSYSWRQVFKYVTSCVTYILIYMFITFKHENIVPTAYQVENIWPEVGELVQQAKCLPASGRV